MKGFGIFSDFDEQLENRIQKGVTHDKKADETVFKIN